MAENRKQLRQLVSHPTQGVGNYWGTLNKDDDDDDDVDVGDGDDDDSSQ